MTGSDGNTGSGTDPATGTGPSTGTDPDGDSPKSSAEPDRPSAVPLRPRQLDAELSTAARTWLDQALAQAAKAAQPLAADGDTARAPRRLPAWEMRFAEAGRRCGPRHADAVRVLLLRAACPDTAAVTRMYTQGSAAERRAVLQALPYLVPGPDALPLVEDALRANDTGLIAAAVGPYAAAHLDTHTWRHAVLKCLFTGVSVDAVADLARRARADGELARMLDDYARERRAAGRPVPDDLYRVLTLTAGTASPEALPAHGTLPRAPGDSTVPEPPSTSTGEES